MPKTFAPHRAQSCSFCLSVLPPNKARPEGGFVSHSFSTNLGRLLFCIAPDKNLLKGRRIYCAQPSWGYSASWEGNCGSKWELQWREMGGFLLIFPWLRGGRLDKAIKPKMRLLVTRDSLPPTWPHKLYKLPKQCHQPGTKCSHP